MTDSSHSRGVKGITPLYSAAISGDIQLAKRLLAGGAEVNPTGETAAPIHGAVLGGKVKMVLLLLVHGADQSLRDHKGRDARRLAQELGRADIAELLKDEQ